MHATELTLPSTITQGPKLSPKNAAQINTDQSFPWVFGTRQSG